MENPTFMDDFPIETSMSRGFSIAMFDYQRVYPGMRMISSDKSVSCPAHPCRCRACFFFDQRSGFSGVLVAKFRKCLIVNYRVSVEMKRLVLPYIFRFI